MKSVVQQSSTIVDKTLQNQERTNKIKEEVKRKFAEDQKRFEDMKIRIDQNVAARPLLVQQG